MRGLKYFDFPHTDFLPNLIMVTVGQVRLYKAGIAGEL